MKLKMTRGRWTLVIVVVLVIGAVLISKGHAKSRSGPGTMDKAAGRTCDTFNGGYHQATDKPARLALADKVSGWSTQTANDAIAARAREMGNSAAGSSTDWKRSGDALLSACRAAGWR